MGKIFYVMGKSASGKDTIFKEILKCFPSLETVILYTTRPVRNGEKNGVEYFFTTEEKLDEFCQEGKVIESRTYQTAQGPWTYATVNDGQIDLKAHSYLMIGTLESFRETADYFGKQVMQPIYIEVENGERLLRSIKREGQQEKPEYTELCRRFIADESDFSEEKLRDAGISKHYDNKDIKTCLKRICHEIRTCL